MTALSVSPVAWPGLLAAERGLARAQALAGALPSGSSIRFFDGETALRTITTGAWTVGDLSGGTYPVAPGSITDSATGAGTPTVAVIRNAEEAEVLRLPVEIAPETPTPGTLWLAAPLSEGVPVSLAGFSVGVLTEDAPPEPPAELEFVGVPATITAAVGLSHAMAQYVRGGAAPYTFSATGLPSGVTINASTGVLTVAPEAAEAVTVGVQVTVTDAESASDVATFDLNVTDIADVVVTTFKIENWGAAPTPGFHRVGLPFRKGDIPAGLTPRIVRGGNDVAAQFDERATWKDGSLKFCVGHIRDSEMPVGEREYEVRLSDAPFDNAGNKTLSDVTSATDFKVAFTDLAQWDGTTSAQRGSGAALAAFNTHAAVATRVTKIHSGPVCEGWQVWGMARDGATGSGAEDAHLKTIWYVDIWKDAEGDVADIEFAAEVAQDWWGVAGKYRLDYDAELTNGSAVETYAGVEHPYHSHWITVRKADDNNHARRHWLNEIPTLVYKPNKLYWVRTELVPPLDTDFAPRTHAQMNLTTSYVPCSAQKHRAGINPGGSYMGRGMMPHSDCIAFMLQSATEVRHCRTNNMAGLHVPYHYRDERTRTRPGESADTANTLIPLIWSPKASSASTFVGLPEPKNAYMGSATSEPMKGGWVAPTGGEGVWLIGTPGDMSHAVAYSTYGYLLEGERYFLEAMIDLATRGPSGLNGTIYGAVPYIHWYENTVARAEMSIPSTTFAAIPDLRGQERAIGFGPNVIAGPISLAPDSDPQGQYMRGWGEHCSEYVSASVGYTPPSLAAAGVQFFGGHAMRSPWMTSFAAQGCSQAWRMTELDGFRQMALLTSRMVSALLSRSMYDTETYWALMTTAGADYAGPSSVRAWGEYLGGGYEFVVADGNRISSEGSPSWGVQDDDVIVFPANGYQGVPPVPPEVTRGIDYFVVDASPDGKEFSVAATPGGDPISLTPKEGAPKYRFAGKFYKGVGVSVPNAEMGYPGSDDYPPIHEAALVYATLVGSEKVAPSMASDLRTFLAGIDQTDCPVWKMEVPA